MRRAPLICALWLAGCGAAVESAKPDAGPGGVTAAAPDFALVDANPTSDTYGQAVSPRDVLERVSGWYFTHAS